MRTSEINGQALKFLPLIAVDATDARIYLIYDLLDLGGPEINVDGWNAKDGEYSFFYAAEQPAEAPGAAAGTTTFGGVLLKCLTVDGGMFVTLMACGSKGPQLPETLELELARFAVPEGADAADTAACLSSSQYGHLQELAGKLQMALDSQLARASSTSAAASKASSQSAGDRRASEGRPMQDVPMRTGQQVPSRSPLMVGDEDILPGGMPDPLRISGPRGGIMPFGPMGVGGGGMHVGPDHPFFSDRLRNPGLAAGGMHGPGHPGLPAGARWDPIAPEGLQGWNPDDFQREGRADPRRVGPPVHPDMMQPGAGRGTDWDHMFG